MAVEAQRWVSYGEAADLLGLSTEATKRLALRRGWPRRAGPAGGTLVAVPDALADDPDDAEPGRGGARSLLDYLEVHVERLTEELAEARTEMRGVRYEAESLRIEAGRAQVLAALVEAERARSAEIRAERDRLAAELAEARTEMRGVRYEAESLRIEAGRAQVLAALVEAERARSAEIRAERDRLADELAEHRRPWLARALWALFDRGPARRRRWAF